jgi:hypothetical protein
MKSSLVDCNSIDPASMGRRGGLYTIGRKLVAAAGLFKRSRSLDCAQAKGPPAGGLA